VKRSPIQPIPPELEACEVCGKLQCPDDEWKRCERRIATAEFIRTGDRAAFVIHGQKVTEKVTVFAPPMGSEGLKVFGSIEYPF
jgi:hypothetical protein